ncbi:hypothetical protein F4820DRAFT_253061 [Hypoxylon rubiginosum]|uniref:Uncharacterized protein n=1 Tax=Hypoxylon rubiginosum TaxID=110542 RepID=A0ACB9ZG34_9PEZI|nr:hypothetical protein F4820DRAFT_253061 [Hypoxylon rubiginosum]
MQQDRKPNQPHPDGYQLIASQYIDPTKLVRKLNEKFGEDSYRVEMRHNQYIIRAQGHLTEDDIKACYY